MSGPQKPNYFLIWAIWGSIRPHFRIISYYLGVPPGSPMGPYWLLLAPIGSQWDRSQVSMILLSSF